MKYKRLTKEQFESLHQEFTNFLASQSIDREEWSQIKQTQPQVAEQELDVFSDLIWEGVLTNARFLEHFSKNHIFLFHCQESQMETIIIKSFDETVDFLSKSGLQWLGENVFTSKVEVIKGKKQYDIERNTAIFNYILQGAVLSDGQLYIQIMELLNQ